MGPAECSPRKLSSSVSSTKDYAGGRAGGQHPLHRLPESNLVAGGDDAKNSHQTWHQHHGQASPSPFRLGDIACNTRFIKGHKPSNHIRARIKSHVYTTE